MSNLPFASQIDAVIEDTIDAQRLVGAVVLIAQDGDVIYRKAAGLADREARRPMRVDAIFRYASLTKPIVTAAAMSLVEAGGLGLDDAISLWIPEFRPKTADGLEPSITIRNLLTHTAGLTYGIFQPLDGPYFAAGISDGIAEPGLSMDEELRRLAGLPLSYMPGTAWGYSLALDVMGEVLARVTGKPLPQVVEETVTGVLGMTDTAFEVRDISRLAVPYVDATPPRRMTDPDLLQNPLGMNIRYSLSRIFDARSFPSGGAGMAGTATDMLTFLETIRQGGGPILKPETARAMMTNQIGDLRITTELVPAWGFGFGGAILLDPELAQVPQSFGTWKWGGVYGHHWYVDPVRRLTVVALTNTTTEGMSGEFVAHLKNAIYAAVTSPDSPSQFDSSGE